MYAKGDIERLRNAYMHVAKLSLAIMVPIALCLLFMASHSLDSGWGKENFAGTAVLTLLVTMNLFHALGTPAVSLLQGIGRNKGITYSEIVNAALNLLLSIVLVNKMGLTGIAIGTLLAHLCTSFWVVQLSVFRSARLGLMEYLFTAALPPLLTGLISAGLAWVVKQRLFQADNLLYLVLNGIIILTIYAAFYFIIGSNKEKRRMYFRLIQGILKNQ